VTEKPARTTNDMYVTKGINREKVMEDAAKRSSDGVTNVMVHIHSKNEPCAGGHYEFSDGKQVQAW
jgi:hypothetical protein